MLNMLSVIFLILSEQLSGISFPCLLLLFKHKYGLPVCGVGPCCFVVSHFTEYLMAICRLAAKAKPLQGELSSLAQPSCCKDGFLPQLWLNKSVMEMQGSGFKRLLLIFFFLFFFNFPSKVKLGNHGKSLAKGVS